ncbi:MAG TPA: alpha-L-rhamnosidase C-terminal domain-containing protein, partial [Prolixibacteraceae bacterium]
NFVDWAIEWPWLSESRIGGVPEGARMDSNSSILTMQFAYAVQRAAELNEFYGNTSEALKYKQLAQKLTAAVYKNCWDAQKGYLGDTPAKHSFSMHAQIFGVLTNTISEARQQAFVGKFIDDKTLIQPTMYFRFYLTQALKKAGLADRYLKTLGLWETMLQNGLTTFPENPDPARSDCHAWSASPNYDFLATVAGIRPGTPGFKSVRMEPALGSLKFIKGQMPHPLGMISFDLKRAGADGLEGWVELPGQLTGTFVWKGKSIAIKGKTAIKF